MYELKPDFEESLERFEAWWHGEIVDRPPVWITAPSGDDSVPWPTRSHRTVRDRWFDIDYNLDAAEAGMARTAYLADAFPYWWPNLGPEVYAGFLGCPLEYTETTSWAVPILDDWGKLDQIGFDSSNEYWVQISRMTDAAIERARGRYPIGYTDLHPGADAACAFRDPAQLCIDLLDSPEEARQLLQRVQEPFASVFDELARRLESAGSPVITWLPVAGRGRVHIPSNDFSCMVSPAMMEEFFIGITVEECALADRSVYHLDGRDAMKHLDLLLEVPNLHAIQPTIGAGDAFDEQWLDVLRRTRAAGKSVHLACGWDVVETVMESFCPEGFLFVLSAASVHEAEDKIRRIARWRV